MRKWKKIGMGCVPFLVAICIMSGGSILAGMIWVLFSPVFDIEQMDEQAQSMLVLLTTGFVYLLYIVFFFLWLQRLKDRSGYGEKKRNIGGKDILCLVLLGIVLQFVVSVLLGLILPFFPETNAAYQELVENLVPGNSLLSFVITGLLAPIGEEFIFRGVTISLMEEEISFGWINLMQAFLFGVYHMNLVQFIYAFAIGMILGLVLKKYRNLKACIIVHGTINILANVLSYIG